MPDLKKNQAAADSVTHIRPPRKLELPSVKELWPFRELLLFLTMRDIKIRYKQTALGIAWAAIPPACQMLIFSALFGVVAKMPSEGVSYPVFSFSGLIIWGLLSKSVDNSANSLLTGATLSTKVHFPRLIFIISSVLTPLVDFCIAFAVLLILIFSLGMHPPLNIFLFPIVVLFALLTALAAGLWLSALSVQYRDLKHVTMLLTQLWMFVSPVVYSATALPEGMLKEFYWLNPAAIIVQGFRWCVIGLEPPPLGYAAGAVCLVLVLLISGLYYFTKVEKTYVDLI